MRKKFAANSIADEMFRLLKKASDEKAVAEKAPEEDEADDDSSEMMKHIGDNADDDSSKEDDAEDDAEDDLKSFLLKGDDDSADDDASYVDDEIKTMQSHSAEDDLMRQDATENQSDMHGIEGMVASASDRHLMSGLGKIEASLRRKGEGFAADLVRTTALSIQDDIVKEASQKTFVIKNLIKMASDLDRRGQRKAASVVKMTIEKINR